MKASLNTREYLQELDKDFYLVKAPNQSRFPYCNTFLLRGAINVLIDAGIDRETLLEMDRARRIDVLVIGHSHPDHILNWHCLKDRHILMPRETPDSVRHLQVLGERFTGSHEKGAHWVEVIGNGLGLQPLREPNNRFADGDMLEFGDFRIKAVHAPGHLNDHYVFLEETTGNLLSSDIDFSAFGPFYGQPECDIDRFKMSIVRVMKLPYKRVCPSHKPPVEGDATELFDAFLDGFERHQQNIHVLLDKALTIDQIVAKSPIYNDRMPEKVLQEVFEKGMVSKSLDQMIRKGSVVKIGEHYRRV